MIRQRFWRAVYWLPPRTWQEKALYTALLPLKAASLIGYSAYGIVVLGFSKLKGK